jgi:WD40 repeat protein
MALVAHEQIGGLHAGTGTYRRPPVWLAVCVTFAFFMPGSLEGQERPVVVRVPHLIRSLAFSPKGDFFAAGFDGEGRVLVYELRHPDRPTSIRGNYVRAQALAFSPNGRLLAVPDAWETPGPKGSGGVRIWDYRNPIEGTKLACQEGLVSAIAFSPGSDRLATGHDEGGVVLWDVVHAKMLRKLAAHDDIVTTVAF